MFRRLHAGYIFFRRRGFGSELYARLRKSNPYDAENEFYSSDGYTTINENGLT